MMTNDPMELVRRARSFTPVQSDHIEKLLEKLLIELADALEAAHMRLDAFRLHTELTQKKIAALEKQSRADEEAMRAALGSDQISNFEPLVERLAARKETSDDTCGRPCVW